MKARPPTASEVAVELEKLSRRLIDRAFVERGKQKALSLPGLRHIAEEKFPQQWQESESTTLELMLRLAIQSLDGWFGAITRQEAAFRLFNIDGGSRFPQVEKLDLKNIGDKKEDDAKLYDYLRDKLVEAAGLFPPKSSTVRRKLNELRHRIAKVIVDPAYPSMQPFGSEPVSSMDRQGVSGPQPLIPRDDDLTWLHTTYNQLVDQGGIFVLWGLAGSGKTTLARQFGEQIAPKNAVGFIRVGRTGLYEEDIRRVLRVEGHDDSLWSDEHCRAIFRNTATKLRASRLLILDGIRGENDITALFPNGSSVPVLVTTRERLRIGQSMVASSLPARSLSPFTTEQATSFLGEHIPGLDPEICSELAAILRGHAETIYYVVHYLAGDDAVDPRTLLKSFNHNATGVLTDLTEVLEVPHSLPLILRQLHRRIAKGSFADAILATIIWTNSSGEGFQDLVIAVVGELLHHPSALELRAALHELERLGLLTSTDDSFVVPRLSCEILRQLLMHTRERVLIAYEQAIAIPPSEGLEKSRIEALRYAYDFARITFAAGTTLADDGLDAMRTWVILDASSFVLFASKRSGKRVVWLHRIVPSDQILRLSPGRQKWEELEGDEALRCIKAAIVIGALFRQGLREYYGEVEATDWADGQVDWWTEAQDTINGIYTESEANPSNCTTDEAATSQSVSTDRENSTND